MDNGPHVDSAALDRLTEWGGAKLLQQMVRLFLENSRERLDQIDTGLAGDDIDQVERGSHSLKSSAANVGATRVSRLAADMEAAAETSDWDSIRRLRPDLGTALEAAIAELELIVEGTTE